MVLQFWTLRICVLWWAFWNRLTIHLSTFTGINIFWGYQKHLFSTYKSGCPYQTSLCGIWFIWMVQVCICGWCQYYLQFMKTKETSGLNKTIEIKLNCISMHSHVCLHLKWWTIFSHWVQVSWFLLQQNQLLLSKVHHFKWHKWLFFARVIIFPK